MGKVIRMPVFWIIICLAAAAGAVAVWFAASFGTPHDENAHRLKFSEADRAETETLDLSSVNIIEEKTIDQDLSAYIFTDDEDGEYKGAVSTGGKSYYVGLVSMEGTPGDLMGIKEVQVFGKKAVKFYGILGANYPQALYWLTGENPEDSVIQIDGNTTETDLDNDTGNEIVATVGTIPETNIYVLKDSEISVSDINRSLGAKSVRLMDENNKLFEVYFEPNKPEQFVYQDGSFVKKRSS
ncbi:MAG TPA: hypothetical protein PLG72_01095 [Clostridiales bacterium]|nr:hypothetical protein [Clostridiales bacterium]